MPYTFVPKEKHAKAYSTLFISPKNAKIICRVINKKKLSTARRLLSDLTEKKRDLERKYYSTAAEEISKLVKSCEKNAEALGLESNKLFIYASSSVGANLRRGRRRSDFGHRMKVTNVSIILVEKGKSAETTKKPAKKDKVVKTEKAEKKTEAVAKE